MASTSPRVERGAALLDVTAPGWEGKITLATLDLGNWSCCVLGQLYGNYDAGIEEIDGDAQRHPIAFGFLGQANEDYERLTEKWKHAIRRRLRSLRAA